MKHHQPIPLDAIRAARERIKDVVLRTPLVRLNVDNASLEILLKLENLQPVGSFKLRGAGNAMHLASSRKLTQGVWTASAGNMAHAVAWYARRMDIPCSVVVPDNAQPIKLAAIRQLGADIVQVPFSQYQEIQRRHCYGEMEGLLIHPFSDAAVMAGNGTIGLEILEDLPDVDAVAIPYGGGGLSCGIASSIRAVRPDVRVYGCEVETAAPLAASFLSGAPVEVEYRHSFVSGMGAPFVFPEMWPLARRLLTGVLVVTLQEVASAMRLLAQRNRVIAEGAGAVPVAAALAGKAGRGKVACVVSGGNVETAQLIQVLQGKVPV